MLTKIPPRLARIVGTRLGTRESILRRSRGSNPCSEHSRDFLNTPEVDVAEPVESKMVHRSMMSGESWVVPSPANEAGGYAALAEGWSSGGGFGCRDDDDDDDEAG